MSTLYRISPITGLVAYRPCSVFVSTGRFQNFVITSWMIILGFGGYLILRSKKGRTTAFVSIGALAGAVLMSTSRGVMMWSAGSALVIAYFTGQELKHLLEFLLIDNPLHPGESFPRTSGMRFHYDLSRPMFDAT